MSDDRESLREAATAGKLVTASCRSCAHSATFLARDLVAFADPEKPLSTIRFRCSECAGDAVSVVPTVYERDRRPDVIVWRPTRLR